MSKLFVVTSNPTTVEQDRIFQQWLESKFTWWHWLNQTWLLVDTLGVHSATEIRDKMIECFPQTYFVVLELNPSATNWAGFGPNNETDATKNMFAWLNKNWRLQ